MDWLKGLLFGMVALMIGVLILAIGTTTFSTVESWSTDFDYTYSCEAEDECSNSYFAIGDTRLEFNRLFYRKGREKCRLYDDGAIRVPDPHPQCWYSTIKYEDEIVNVSYGDAVSFNDYIEVQFLPEGRVYYNREYKGKLLKWDFKRPMLDWENHYKITIDNGFIDFDVIPERKAVHIDEEAMIPYDFKNNLANNMESGIVVEERYFFIHDEEVMTESFVVVGDRRVNDFSFDPKRVGRVSLRATPFVNIHGKRIIGESETLDVDVLREDEELPSYDDAEEEKGFFDNIFDFIKGMFEW